MYFNIAFDRCESDTSDFEYLLFEGSDLAALATDLQSHRDYWDSLLSDVGAIRNVEIATTPITITITTTTTTTTTTEQQQGEAPIDWQAKEAHEFCQALSDLKCDVVVLHNLFCFPLHLLKIFLAHKWVRQVVLDHDNHMFRYDFGVRWSSLDTMPSSSASLWPLSSSSLPENEIMVGDGCKLEIKITFENQGATYWTSYASYLHHLASNQQKSFVLKNVELEYPWEVCDTGDAPEIEQQQLVIQAVASLRTESFSLKAEEFPPFLVPNLTCTSSLQYLHLNFCNLSLSLSSTMFPKCVSINTKTCTNPDWLLIAAWLQQIRRLIQDGIKDSCSFYVCMLDARPREEINSDNFLTLFESMCAFQPGKRILIHSNTSGPSWKLVPILLKSFQASGKAMIRGLEISTLDCDWVNDDDIIKAMKANTRILGLTIEAAHFQPETLKNLENVLRVNHTMSSLLLTMHWGFQPLTPTLQMYVQLNKHGKRQLLASKGAPDLSQEEWIGLLISITNEDSNAANTDCLKLSCLFYFVRNYSSYYAALFWN